MQTIVELNKQFAIEDRAEFVEGPSGQIQLNITSPSADATIIMQGAHIIDWTPAKQKPVLWLSEDASFAQGKSIRGGIPICWPWFGTYADQKDFPAHGFARVADWQLNAIGATDETTCLEFELVPARPELWPHATPAVYEIVIGKSLDLKLTTFNQSDNNITLGQALHTYFNIADARQIVIHGLAGLDYLDKVENFDRFTQEGDVTLASEVDRIYLNSSADCIINDPQWQRKIRISKSGSNSSVVWNPWQETANKMGDLGADGYLNMVCVESANAADDVVQLAPSESHTLSVSYTIE